MYRTFPGLITLRRERNAPNVRVQSPRSSGVMMNVLVHMVVDVLMGMMVSVAQRSLSVSTTEAPLAGLSATLISGRRLRVFKEAGHGRRAGAGLRSDARCRARGTRRSGR